MKDTGKRFRKVQSQSLGLGEGVVVFVDTRTGVNYLYFRSGYGGGLTPLLNRDGTPVVTSAGYELEN